MQIDLSYNNRTKVKSVNPQKVWLFDFAEIAAFPGQRIQKEQTTALFPALRTTPKTHMRPGLLSFLQSGLIEEKR
jgi:hypothetical protein